MFFDQVDPLFFHRPHQNVIYVRSGCVLDRPEQVVHNPLKLCGGICEPHDTYGPLVNSYGGVDAGILSTVGVQGLLVESIFQVNDGKECIF